MTITAQAEFAITAEGDELSYQWQVSTDSGETWADLEGACAVTLQVVASADNNGYQYRCVVTDCYGASTVSDAATLTVNGGMCGESAYWVLEDGVLRIFGSGAMAN